MLSAKTPTNVIKLKKENNRERSFLMNVEELARYKNMSAEEIDRKIVPDIEDIKDKKNAEPLSMYFMKVGNVIVKCSYAENGRSLEDCFLSYLKKKAKKNDGHNLVGIYKDIAKTGTEFERPDFEKLVGEVRTGKVNCIIVKDLSRFGRNYTELGRFW